MRTFIIHHLSDVHLGSSHYRPSSKASVFPAATSRNADAYINHLRQLNREVFPDLIVLSGDLTTVATEREMEEASDFLDQIAKIALEHHTTGTNVPRLLVVPGNHDVDWLKDSPIERHNRYSRLADGIFSGGFALSSMYRHVQREPWFDFGDDPNVFICLFNSTYYGGAKDPALAKLYEQIRSAADQIRVDGDALEAFKREVQKDPGFVLESEINNAVARVSKLPPGRVKIAVVHHNPNHVPTDDVEAYDTIVNAGRFKSALLQAGFDIVLHGHRHVFHCSVESHPSSPFARQKLFFVGSDSLGCKENAPFLELQIRPQEIDGVSGTSAPDFSVREFEFSPAQGYTSSVRFSGHFSGKERFDITDLGIDVSANMSPEFRAKALEVVKKLLPRLQTMRSALTDWKDNSEWIRLFHIQLPHYHQVLATDVYVRSNIGSASFQRYLREQYSERLKRLRRTGDNTLRFSPDVHKAIIRSQWEPSSLAWPGCKIQRTQPGDPEGLEIVRVMIVDPRSADQLELRNLDYDHAMHAIPLFVIDRCDLSEDMIVDFAMGMSASGTPIKTCAYEASLGQVLEQQPWRAYALLDVFERLLAHPRLRTVERFFGSQPMLRDPASNALFATQYSKYRKASPLVTRVLENHFPEGRQRAVDLCCGTGNYTLPFVGRFGKLIGLDISPQMLMKAKERSNQVEWVEADARETNLEAGAFDVAWMISALHYFKGEQQLGLFEEVFRILRPGGVFIADNEFAEQHPSLWLVEYFPSLRTRYEGCLFSQDQYKAWLEQVGFSVEFETYDYHPEEGDAFLRIGQHMPKLYLDERIQAAIPAFQSMDPLEKRRGFQRLREEIATGEIEHIVKRYKAKASLPGDFGFLLARRK